MTTIELGIESNSSAFAALKTDGTVVAWGNSNNGGDGVPSGLSGVKAIYSTSNAFAALKENGTVAAWGASSSGGDLTSDQLSQLTQVKTITYGKNYYQGKYLTSAVPDPSAIPDPVYDSSPDGTPSLIGTEYNFYHETGIDIIDYQNNLMALLTHKLRDVISSIVVKDDPDDIAQELIDNWYFEILVYGQYTRFDLNAGTYSNDATYIYFTTTPEFTPNVDYSAIYCVKFYTKRIIPDRVPVREPFSVVSMHTNTSSFAALRENGTVVTWGESTEGGTSPSGLKYISAIYSTAYGFAALKEDGTVESWGYYIGNNGGSGVPSGLTNVKAISSTSGAFAALKEDGTVAAWGSSEEGGNVPYCLSDVKEIYSNGYAFAALTKIDTVVVWGDSTYGGSVATSVKMSNIKTIFSSYYSFAALKHDGTVIAWGDSDLGGSAPAGLSNVKTICATDSAFAALKEDGTVVSWGYYIGNNGGSGVPSGLSGVKTIYSTG